jgi:hypothetical protein
MEAELITATKGDVPGKLFTYAAMCPLQRDPTMDEHPLIYMKATASDPDTMYLHKAMKEPDALDFKKAMQKEVQDQTDGEVFRLMQRSQVPKGATILPAVWQMKQKRHIKTHKVYK